MSPYRSSPRRPQISRARSRYSRPSADCKGVDNCYIDTDACAYKHVCVHKRVRTLTTRTQSWQTHPNGCHEAHGPKCLLPNPFLVDPKLPVHASNFPVRRLTAKARHAGEPILPQLALRTPDVLPLHAHEIRKLHRDRTRQMGAEIEQRQLREALPELRQLECGRV